jgi:hypothetical protein
MPRRERHGLADFPQAAQCDIQVSDATAFSVFFRVPFFAFIPLAQVDVMHLTVDTRKTQYGDEEPIAFLMGPRRVQVMDILDRWLSTEQSYYKVLTDDGALYILRQDAASREWEMTLFRATP